MANSTDSGRHDSGETSSSPKSGQGGKHSAKPWGGGPVGNQDPAKRGLGAADSSTGR